MYHRRFSFLTLHFFVVCQGSVRDKQDKIQNRKKRFIQQDIRHGKNNREHLIPLPKCPVIDLVTCSLNNIVCACLIFPQWSVLQLVRTWGTVTRIAIMDSPPMLMTVQSAIVVS